MKRFVLFSFILLTCFGGVSYAQDAYKRVKIAPIDSNFYIKDRLKGEVIIVTGGARGIGRASAIRAAREGATVVIGDWLPVEGAATAAFITKEGNKALFVETDIRKTEDCNRLVATAVKTFGKVDAALLNAGVMDGVYSGDSFNYEQQKKLLPAAIYDATDEYWDEVFAVNATGTFRSMRAVAKQMLKQGKGGSIVLVGSIAGLTGLPGNPAYVASKHAVEGLTQSGAVDLAPYGIRVNSVNMAATNTPMVQRAMEFVLASMKHGQGSMGDSKTKSLLSAADGRDATVWEQAAPILFLLSDESSNLTGGLFPTDGGWTAF